jgi:coenzyme F420-0:L-glutamate ligase/coenzyme F420-1:gamma-L-glutamate ligase
VLIQINRRYKLSQSGVRITGFPKAQSGRPMLSVHGVAGLPLLQPGDDLAALIAQALTAGGFVLQDGDVLVVAQKAISKVEGRQIALSGVVASAESEAAARESGKPAELIELIRRESDELMRVRPGVVISRHRLGTVAANAGIDASNVAGDNDTVLLWPVDPDASAQRLRSALKRRCGATIAVVISDSLGRAWRLGTTGTAIGVAGLNPLRDRRGETDLTGRVLQATVVGVADEIAAAASLVIGEAAEGLPVAVVRGATYQASEDATISALLRSREEDLFP